MNVLKTMLAVAVSTRQTQFEKNDMHKPRDPKKVGWSPNISPQIPFALFAISREKRVRLGFRRDGLSPLVERLTGNIHGHTEETFTMASGLDQALSSGSGSKLA